MSWQTEEQKERLNRNRSKEEIIKELSNEAMSPIGLNDKTFLCKYSVQRGYPTTYSVPSNEKELMDLYTDMQSYEHYYNRLNAEEEGRDYFVLK
jgi:hypothetical protein